MKNKENKLKNGKQIKPEKGITLVALVITVVVMLILAGVAIAAVVNGDGLFSRARESADIYENAAQDEQDKIQSMINEIDGYLNNSQSTVTDGSFDSTIGLNTPDTSALPKDTTKYVTWNYNEANSVYEEVLSDTAPNSWYDYNNGQWANIKTTANGLEAYWVWIPRFAYKMPNTTGNGDEKEIEVIFVKNNSKEGANGETCYYSTDTEITTDGSGLYVNKTADALDKWIVHPAFTFGDDQLNGIWVAKYEASNPDCTTEATSGEYNGSDKQVEIKPNVTSWRYIQVANAFTVCENMTKTGGVIGTTSGNNSTIDTHMMKNMEWGAVAVLSQSQYGVFNPESATGENGDKTYKVWSNPNSSYITGSAGNIADATNQASTSSYNTNIGVKASTTGTIYGIYDMAGGSWEPVMGLMAVNNLPNEPSVGQNDTYNTGFIGKFSDGTISSTGIRNLPESKYYDLYAYGVSNEDFYRGKIGDLTRELNPSDLRTWNDDYAQFVHQIGPIFYRGSAYRSNDNIGVFAYSTGGNSGAAIKDDSFRPVLVIL